MPRSHSPSRAYLPALRRQGLAAQASLETANFIAFHLLTAGSAVRLAATRADCPRHCRRSWPRLACGCRRCCPVSPVQAYGERSGAGLDRMPSHMVMEAEAMVDAALRGFEVGETVTLPSLPDAEDWNRLLAARAALGPNLSRDQVAPRYRSEV